MEENMPQNKPSNPSAPMFIILGVVVLAIAALFMYFGDYGSDTNTNSNTTTNTNVTTNNSILGGTYSYNSWNISFDYPTNSNVTVSEDGSYIRVRGTQPSDDGRVWPNWTITHHSTDYYNPPSGTNVEEWVDGGSLYDGLGEEYMIDNQRTVHVIEKESSQSVGADIYYVIKGDKLFEITIFHEVYLENQSGDLEFLESISFNK